ncbi:MAG TPA: ankyrin repeat domain-containing protein, partial [Candidatus Binatia bacterium]|nr:ankyrin repeat domain-containing protein [Candidatus Binatia bacterium]
MANGHFFSGGKQMKRVMADIFLAMVFFSALKAAPVPSIHEAAKTGDTQQIKKILTLDRWQLNAKDAFGYTPLHWSLIRAQWPAADCLLAAGADPCLVGDDGATTLHCAANHDNAGIVGRLITRGVDPNVKNIWGNTPLALTVQRGCARTARALIAHGADIRAQTEEGWTPLHLAYRSGQPLLQKILVELGADEQARDRANKKPVELNFVRPALRPIAAERYGEYTGAYDMGDGFMVRVFQDGSKLMLEDYAQDEIYPIAPDTFYDLHEPWRIRFFRDRAGRVDKIVLDFQTLSVIGRKAPSAGKAATQVRLGVATRPLAPGDVSAELLMRLFFEQQANSHAQLLTQVASGSSAEKAGLLVGDIILEFNNTALREPLDL